MAGYAPLIALAESITNDSQLQFRLACIAFFAGILFTPLYPIRVGKPHGRFEWLNIGIATFAFVLWAYLLGGPFAMQPMNNYLWSYDKRIASFVVGLFTWGVASIPYENFAPKAQRAAAAQGRQR